MPLVDLKAQYRTIEREIDGALREVLESQQFILGPAVESFEDSFARYLGVTHFVGASSGTTALWLALRAVGVEEGDEVVTTALTYFATIEAIAGCGAVPVFVDVEPRTLTLDPALVERAIGPKTKAIVAVHLYGQTADMDALNSLAAARGVTVVEDAAQAAGSRYKGRKAGTLARAAAFSFYPGKNLGAYGDAGGVATSDDAVAAAVRRLRHHGMEEKNRHDVMGINARMDALQAAVLSAKLPRLDAWNAARRRLAEAYRRALTGVAELACLEGADAGESNQHLFVVRHRRRDALLAHLRGRGIEAAVHYPIASHRQPALGALATTPGLLPVVERAVGEVLSLPLFPEMTPAQVTRVIDAIRSFR